MRDGGDKSKKSRKKKEKVHCNKRTVGYST